MADYENLHDAVLRYENEINADASQKKAFSILEQWQAAIVAKDIDTLVDMMHEKILIELPFNESGHTDKANYRRYAGKEECKDFWLVAFSAEGKVHGVSEIDLTCDGSGSRIFMECRGHLTMSNGRDYRNRYVMRFDISDGKVIGVKEYYNPIQSAYAFGRPIAGQVTLETL